MISFLPRIRIRIRDPGAESSQEPEKFENRILIQDKTLDPKPLTQPL